MKHNEARKRNAPNEIKIGLISVSDRASKGVYQDEGIPALQTWLQKALINPCVFHERLIADEAEIITETIVELVDDLALVIWSSPQAAQGPLAGMSHQKPP